MKAEELKYTKDHVWVAAEGDLVIMGITDHAQKELGDIVFLELPELGRKCSPGQAVGSIESIKTTNDLLAPVSGEVVEVNPLVRDKPDTVNIDPLGEGWLLKIRVSQPEELLRLMDFDTYQQSVQR